MSYNVLVGSSQMITGGRTFTLSVMPSGNSLLVDFHILGGYFNGTGVMPMRLLVNGTLFTPFQCHRWVDHSTMIADRRLVTLPPSVLTPPPSPFPVGFPFSTFPLFATLTLRFEAFSASDYFFLGPLVIHTS